MALDLRMHNKRLRKSELWWRCYRVAFHAIHRRKSDGFEFSGAANDATDAIFAELDKDPTE